MHTTCAPTVLQLSRFPPESHATVSGDIEPNDSVETRLEKLEALLALSTEQPQAVTPYARSFCQFARQIAVGKSLIMIQ